MKQLTKFTALRFVKEQMEVGHFELLHTYMLTLRCEPTEEFKAKLYAKIAQAGFAIEKFDQLIRIIDDAVVNVCDSYQKEGAQVQVTGEKNLWAYAMNLINSGNKNWEQIELPEVTLTPEEEQKALATAWETMNELCHCAQQKAISFHALNEVKKDIEAMPITLVITFEDENENETTTALKQAIETCLEKTTSLVNHNENAEQAMRDQDNGEETEFDPYRMEMEVEQMRDDLVCLTGNILKAIQLKQQAA